MDKQAKEEHGSTLLILGAGASIGAAKYPIENSWRESIMNMPSGDNFFHDLFSQERTHNHSQRYLNMLGPMYEGLNNLIVRAWALDGNLQGFNPDEWKQINIEDVFTFFDIGAEMYPRGTAYQCAFKLCKKNLTDFITTMLYAKSDGLHCEHLMRLLSYLQPSDSIISFNWDTITDFTLQRFEPSIFKGYLDLMTVTPLLVKDFVQRPILLKLHGSFNWKVCKNRKCPFYDVPRLAEYNGELLRFISGIECPECGNEQRETYIIPPTSRKLIRHRTPLHKFWLIAREKLAQCRQLVFIGYSFPPTDFYSEWLFRQIYFLDTPRPDIIVVNPEILKRRSVVSQRYGRLFRGCTIHRFGTIEDFMREGLHLLKNNE